MPSAVGRYRIDRVLGAGAFASVWLAHDEVLDAQVAVKVLAGGLIDDLDVRNRFLEEARLLRRADSERLVRVHDIGELDDGRPYFVMSYADRGTLADRMRTREMPVTEALRLAVEVARGVEVINRLGIIHRDLKPSNVLFQSTTDGGERLLIADLGLAKALAHASGAFTLPVGTPGYMSPEQARFGGGLDVRADVYGLGALTYHLVARRAPGTAPVRTPPGALRPGLPPAVDEIVMRALEPDRERRWPTAEAFATALSVPLASAHDEPARAGDHDDRRLDETMQDANEGDDVMPKAEESGRTMGDADRRDETTRDAASGGAGAAPHDRTMQVPPPYGAGDQSPYAPGGQTPYGPGDRTPRQAPSSAGEPGGSAHGGAPRDNTMQVPPPYGPAGQTPRHGPHGGGGPGPYDAGEEPSDKTLVDFRIDRPRDGSELRLPDAERSSRSAARQEAKTAESGRNRLMVIAGLAAVLVVGGGGAYAIGKLTGSSRAKPGDGFVTVTDTTGKLSVRVPPAWKLQAQHNTWPVAVTDRATAPALRATPDYAQFVKDDVAVPGVFAGLTHDLNVKLPPATLGTHRAKCTPGAARAYRHGSLSGQITPWKCGSITISETGLRDSGGKFALWVRVKLTGPPDITQKILDSIRTTG